MNEDLHSTGRSQFTRSVARECRHAVLLTSNQAIRTEMVAWLRWSLRVAHAHGNRPFAQLWPGNEVRGIAGENLIDCVVCVSHLSFRFSSALECRSAITVVFLTFPIEAGLVLHSSLMIFHGQVSSGSAGYLPFFRLTGRTSASPTARSYALSTSSLRKIFVFMLVPKSLWTLPSPVL